MITLAADLLDWCNFFQGFTIFGWDLMGEKFFKSFLITINIFVINKSIIKSNLRLFTNVQLISD